VEAATRDLDRDRDSSTLITLKADRDHKRRLLNSDWSSDTPEQPVLPH
jgi:DNA primase